MNHDYPTQAHDHQSLIGGLDHLHSLNQKVAQLHGILVDQFPPLQRITVAVYDERADLLKTFCCSDRLDNPLRKYAAPLAASPSLQSIAKSGRPRVVDDLATYDSGRGDATQWIVTQGYRSSYTMPMLMD
ncbi:MAG TPA: phosphohydrolase, partial [Gammaproteobacteria bacterium]